MIDTGSEITIGNLALRDKLIRNGTGDKFDTVAATGVTGETVKLQLARIAELQLGPVTLHDVPMAFADVPPFKVFGLADEPALAARHRPPGDVPADLARLPGAQGPLPAPPLQVGGDHHQHCAGRVHADIVDRHSGCMRALG